MIAGYFIPQDGEWLEAIYEKFYPKPKPPPPHWFYAYVNNIWENLTDYFPFLKKI